ncbi:MAG TPA: DUF1559 domain-containing protein [Gemmataceae bacterium]|nr:DUF1559 domain-containing protein [Gemmataceae bacterium]
MRIRFRRALRQGFTLIELLVVIAIIGILIALLVPAVQKVRDAAARLQCQNNMKQIGVGLHNYHSVQQRFPTPRGTANSGFTGYRGWMCDLLPYVDQGALSDKMYTNPWDVGFFATFSTPVTLYQCPSDPRNLNAVAPNKGATTSYLGVTGSDNDVYFQQAGPTNGIFNLSAAIRVTDIGDGSSNTLMVGERPPSADLSWGWWGVTDYDTLLSTRQLFGDPFNSTGCVTPGLFGPGSLGGACNGDSNHFWSFHSGGANWLFGDGSVRFLPYSASAATIPLASRSGGETVSLDF